MCCLFAGLALLGPRVLLLGMWIFGNRVDLAFDTWVWPLLGLAVAPWTTVCYVLAWQPGGIAGFWDVALILLGVTLDVMTYASRAAGQKTGVWS